MIAGGEDAILFLGPGAIPRLVAAGVYVTNQPAAIPPGFVAEAGAYQPPQVPAVMSKEQLLSEQLPLRPWVIS